MKKKRLLSCYLVVLLIVFGSLLKFSIFNFQFSISPVLADCPATDYDCQIAELQKEYDARKDAHEKNKTTLAEYEKQVTTLNSKLTSIEKNLKSLEKKIFDREVDLGVQQEVLATRVRNYYINSHKYSSLLLFLSADNAYELGRDLAFRQKMADQDKMVIKKTSDELSGLQKDKDILKKSQISLAVLKKQTSQQAEFMRGEVEKTETYLTQIQAKQKELLALKAGGFETSVGEVPPADDPASRPDYNPGFSPAFAAFSFGAPHRKGMSQYGAYGRSKAGQSAEEILRAYYGSGLTLRKDYSTGINIRVQGHGTVDLETYVKRIYEMPTSWGNQGGFEALKAQAVAARSYALAYTNNGAGSICATESCQVYKPANKGGKWDEAVNATRGWVLTANGQPFSTWYASTAGGYTYGYSGSGYSTPGLWDTPSGRGGWTSDAYEKKAESPWFYKAWYRLRSGGSCGRSHPWLTEDEFTDIVNALIAFKGNSGNVSHLSSLDSKTCLGTDISDTWDKGRVREEAGKYGGPVSHVTSLSVVYSDGGYTQQVTLETDRGRKEFSGEDFKYIFNLRVPGAIGLKSGLFNLMKK
ncbi:MAG: SpoIID/LytB domain-containing protein [bacterium]|nr:SpoIID/LytB domain-containing protein [bacterium]